MQWVSRQLVSLNGMISAPSAAAVTVEDSTTTPNCSTIQEADDAGRAGAQRLFCRTIAEVEAAADANSAGQLLRHQEVPAPRSPRSSRPQRAVEAWGRDIWLYGAAQRDYRGVFDSLQTRQGQATPDLHLHDDGGTMFRRRGWRAAHDRCSASDAPFVPSVPAVRRSNWTRLRLLVDVAEAREQHQVTSIYEDADGDRLIELHASVKAAGQGEPLPPLGAGGTGCRWRST